MNWVAGARPRTLGVGVVPVLVGAASAETFVAWRFVAALLVALGLQVGVNYANDYFDGVRGVDRPDRLGPPRLVASGAASPTVVLVAALGSIFVAGVAGLALALATEPALILFVGALALVAAFAYQRGPRPYAGLGLGEVMVFLFFGLMATCGTAFVMAETVPAPAWWCGSVLGFLAVAVLVANNLRDIPTDAGRASGRSPSGWAMRARGRSARAVAAFATTVVGVLVGLGSDDVGLTQWALLGSSRDRGDPTDGNGGERERRRPDPGPHRHGVPARMHRAAARARPAPGTDDVTEPGDVALACAAASGRRPGRRRGDAGALSRPDRGPRRWLALADERRPRPRSPRRALERVLRLGMAKATGKPATVACTSGTAAAEPLPAVVEASQARVPLLVLTADRPPRVRGTGANQTIVHQALRGIRARRSTCRSRPPSDKTRGGVRPPARRSRRWRPIRSVLSILNCPFEEPLTPVARPRADVVRTDERIVVGAPAGAVGPDEVDRPRGASCPARGAVVVGGLPLYLDAALTTWSSLLGWPVLAEPISNARSPDQALAAGQPRSRVLGSSDIAPRSRSSSGRSRRAERPRGSSRRQSISSSPTSGTSTRTPTGSRPGGSRSIRTR